MNSIALILAALALVPAPRKLVELGGTTDSTAKVFRVDRSLPRTCAIAEIAWTNPKPRSYADFYTRMLTHARRLRAMKIPCAPVDPPGSKRAVPANQRQDAQ